MQEGAGLPLFVFLPRQFLQPLLRHEERVSFCVRDRDVEATRKEEAVRLRFARKKDYRGELKCSVQVVVRRSMTKQLCVHHAGALS